jgi:branched-chain amino acid transport system permease protein
MQASVLRWLGPALWLVGLVAPWMLSANWVSILGIFAIYAIVALSLDIVLGRAGIYDMGHAVYFGIGAYVTAILNVTYGVPVLFTLPVAALLAALAGLVLAFPIIKLRGDYLLVATIGFNEIFRLAMVNDIFGLTGGPNGLYGIGTPSLFGLELDSQEALFYLDWVVLGLVLLLLRNLEHSRFGRAIRYLREDELAAATLGLDPRFYKVLAFALGAGIAGVAGALFATQLSAVSPNAFDFAISVTFFAIVVVGGQASIPGVLLGTVLMFIVPEIFRQLADYRYLFFGVAMIGVMILRPQGIWPRRQGA